MAIDTIAGVWQERLSYHLDCLADVLYVARLDAQDEETYGEEAEPGCHMMHSLADNRPVGLTIVGYWRRSGREALTELRPADLERQLEADVAELATRLAT